MGTLEKDVQDTAVGTTATGVTVEVISGVGDGVETQATMGMMIANIKKSDLNLFM